MCDLETYPTEVETYNFRDFFYCLSRGPCLTLQLELSDNDHPSRSVIRHIAIVYSGNEDNYVLIFSDSESLILPREEVCQLFAALWLPYVGRLLPHDLVIQLSIGPIRICEEKFMWVDTKNKMTYRWRKQCVKMEKEEHGKVLREVVESNLDRMKEWFQTIRKK